MEAVLLPPLVAVPLPVPADPFPQPGTIGASMARAARGHSVLLISSLPCADWIDAGSMPERAGHCCIPCLSRVGAHGRAAVVDGFRAQAVVARPAALDLA